MHFLKALLFGGLASAASIGSRRSNGVAYAPRSAAATGSGTKAVFAHYMIGQTSSDEAAKDIQDAMAVGFDGFALNTHDVTSSYATDAISALFNAASGTNFKLFISCDVSWGGGGASLGDFANLINQYASNGAYYKVNGAPFVSTFSGGSLGNDAWQSQFIQPLSDAGNAPFFVPDFDDASNYPNDFFSTFPAANGAYSWEAAWPGPGDTPANVSDSIDASLIQQASDASKVYMMPLSTFQFKYMGSGQDWYRLGEDNFPQRIGQILEHQPDFVEVITWNDGGESHYVGNVWPDQIACCSSIQAYANGFDHSGWQKVLTPFITAYKAGKTAITDISPASGGPEGAIWYRTLLTSASCSNSITNYQQAVDAINYAIILPSDASGYTINVYSNGNKISSAPGQPGLNSGSVTGLQAGSADSQKVEVVDGSGNVVKSVAGTKDVQSESSSDVCNWNYEVVGL